MGQRGFKQLTARDRVLIAKLKRKKLSISEIARRIGKNKSTVSRELRRNEKTWTPQDIWFWFRIERLWTEEQLDEYLETQPHFICKAVAVSAQRDSEPAEPPSAKMLGLLDAPRDSVEKAFTPPTLQRCN